MNKKNLFAFFAIGALIFGSISCSKELEDRVNVLERRVSVLVTDVKDLNLELTGMSGLIDFDLLYQTSLNRDRLDKVIHDLCFVYAEVAGLEYDKNAELESLKESLTAEMNELKSDISSAQAFFDNKFVVTGITKSSDLLVITYVEDGIEKTLSYDPAIGSTSAVSIDESDSMYTLTIEGTDYEFPKSFANNVTSLSWFNDSKDRNVEIVAGGTVKLYFAINTIDGKSPKSGFDISQFQIYTTGLTKAMTATTDLAWVSAATVTDGVLEVEIAISSDVTSADPLKAVYIEYDSELKIKSNDFGFILK